MTEKELNIKVRLICQVALLGTITSNIRLITVGWDDLKLFHLRAYFDTKPTEDEIEEMDAVCTEVDADIPFEKDKVECLYDLRPRKELERLKCVVYSRKE
jgi:hypothetical protein